MSATIKILYGEREARDHALQQQHLHDVRQRLVAEVEELMTHLPFEGLYWKGTVTDLMEALYMAFRYGRLFDIDGHPRTFTSVARQCSAILNRSCPSNPTAKAARGAQRKGVQESPFMVRYERMVERNPLRHPFTELVGGLYSMAA